jgi:peroxiredoxin
MAVLRARVAFTALAPGGTQQGMPILEVGSMAPDFSVAAHTGETIHLADLRGKNVVLWFYPKADTPG